MYSPMKMMMCRMMQLGDEYDDDDTEQLGQKVIDHSIRIKIT